MSLDSPTPLQMELATAGFTFPETTPNGRFVFFRAGTGSTILPIRVSDQRPLKPIPLGGFVPFDMEVTEDSKLLFIAATFRLIVFDIAGWAADPLCGAIPTLGDPAGCPVANYIRRNVPLSSANGVLGVAFNINNSAVGISPQMGTVYVHSKNAGIANAVLAFNDATRFGDPSIPVSSLPPGLWRKTVVSPATNDPRILFFRRDGTKAFVPTWNPPFYVDPTAGDSLVTLPAINFPPDSPGVDFQIAPNGNFVYAGGNTSAEIFELDSQSLARIRTIPMHDPAKGELRNSFQTWGLSFRADTSRIFVTLMSRSGGTNYVRGHELASGIRSPEIPLPAGGLGPLRIAEASSATPPPDTVRPEVAHITPAFDVVDVPVTTLIGVQFSEPMNQTTLAGAFSMYEEQTSVPVAGTFSLAQDNLTFDPNPNLKAATRYCITMNDTATDPTGNPLIPFGAHCFTSAIPPTVTSVSPDRTGLAAITTNVAITFSEAMDPATVRSALLVTDGVTGGIVDGLSTLASDNKTITFDPNPPPTGALGYDRRYNISVGISAPAKDIAGNPMTSPFSSYFTTVPEPPLVEIVHPLPGTTTNDIQEPVRLQFTAKALPLDLQSLEMYFADNPVGGVATTRVSPAYIKKTFQVGGGVGARSNEPPLLTSLANHAMFAHANSIYVAGGFRTTTEPSYAIFRSPIGSGGALTGWQPAGTIPAGFSAKVLVDRDKAYFIGNTAKIADFSPIDGSIGNFQPASPPTLILGGESVALMEAYGRYIYRIGDFSGGPVEFTRINEVDGTLGPWQQTTSLSLDAGDARGGASAVAWNNRLYVIGGFDAAGVAASTVFYAEADREGRLGAWRQTASLPAGRGRGAAFVAAGQIVYVGGQTANSPGAEGQASVYYTSVQEDGTLAAWNTAAGLTNGIHSQAVAVVGQAAYVSGGISNGPFQIASQRLDLLLGGAQSAEAVFIPPVGLLFDIPVRVARGVIRDTGGNVGDGGGTFAFQYAPPTPRSSADNLAKLESLVNGMSVAKVPNAIAQVEGEVALRTTGDILPAGLGIYDLMPDGTVFGTPATLTLRWLDLNHDGYIDGTGIPGIHESLLVMKKFYPESPSTGRWNPVPGQIADFGNDFISVQLYSASHYALFAPERVAPIAQINTPVHGSTVAALSTPFFVATTTDNSRIDVSSIRLHLDSQDVTAEASRGESGVQFTPGALPSEGTHVFTLEVGDVAGNITVVGSTFAIDSLPPSTSFEIAGASDVFGGTISIAAQATVRLSAVDAISGVDRIEISKDSAPFTTYVSAVGFDEGAHSLRFRAFDRAGNVESLQSLAINVDASPPLTSLAIIGGQQSPGGDSATLYASSSSKFALLALDPLVGGVASGVGFTRYQDNGGVFAVFSSTLSFPEGAHSLAYQSQDRVQNLEVPRSTTILVDATPPQSAVQVGSQSFTDAGNILYVRPLTPFDITAQDPALPGGPGGSGLERIGVSVDGGAFFVFSASLTFTAGAHTISYRAVDRVGNVEPLRTQALRSDADGPVSAIQVGTPSFIDSDGIRYVTPATPVTISALDPSLPGGATGSGVALIEVSLDGGAFAAYSSAMTFAEGRHTVQFRAIDRVGNVEGTQTLTLRSDASQPLTSLVAQGGRQAAGPGTFTFYASSATRFALPAADPLTSDVASGLAFTRYQDNGGAFQIYSSPFALAEGSHALGYQSQDRVSNLEVLRSTTVLMDATPPQSSVIVGSPSFTDSGGVLYITAGTLIGISAQDPQLPGGQSGAGIDLIEASVDGGPYAPINSTLSFSGGSHTILYRSVDRVGNTEAAKTLSIRSDANAPVTTVQIGAPTFVDTDGTRYVTQTTPVTFSAQDPLSGGAAGSGVARIEVAVDGGGYVTYSTALTFIEGRHTILFRAVDKLGNVEASQTLALRSDASMPQSSLALQGGRQASGPSANTFYASTATRFALPALDPVISDVASGLAFTNWRDNGGAFQAYSSSIAFAAGVHVLDYQSQDRLGNLEVLRSTTVRVDGGGPFTIGVYGSPNAIISGVRYVTPATMLWFNSVDTQILPGPVDGSGVDRVMVEIDGVPFTAFVSSLTFAEGRHTVRFRGIDRVENAENIKTVSPWSDGTPPRTTLAVQGGVQASGPSPDSFYASSGTRIALSAVDPLVANVAIGLDFIRWQDNGGVFQNYATPIALTEGVHVFGYQSQDRITNLEVLRSSTVLVDASAPVSTVTVGTPAFLDAGGARFVTPATPVSFSALDPALPGGTAGAGVERIEVSVDGGAFSTYSPPLTFSPGLHTVSYRAKDRVGNIETAQTLTLRSDGASPLTTLAIQGGKQASGPDAASFFASSDTRLALSATDPIVSGVASGVDFTRWQDNGGAFQTYATPSDFSEGAHLVAYQSQDRVGNVEVLRSTTILVDATAPTVSLSVGLPRADRDGTRYVSTSTLLTIGAEDPSSAGSASGVGVIEKSVDASPFSAYAGPFGLAGGLGLISARAADRVGNVSPVLSTSVVVDAAAPVFTALAPAAGARFLPSGARLEVVVQAADDYDTAPPISATLVQLEDRGSPRGNRPAVVPVQNGSSFASLDLDDGLWELRAGAVDFVANGTSAVSGPFEVIHDLMPPRTSLSAGTPLALVAGTSVVARGTPLTLASIDDLVSLGDALGLGVTTQRVSVDGIVRATFTAPTPGPGITFINTFALASEGDGWHEVAYSATDVLGNIETTRVSTLGVDDTAPETSLAVLGGRQTAGPDALTFYASSGTNFSLPAIDRVVNGVASGVDFTRWQDNGGTFTTYTGPFALQEGPHLLAYQSQDRLGKLEVLHSTTVLIDSAAPQSSSAFGMPTLVDTDGTRFVTPATTLSFSAQDPALPGGTAGSGVDRIEASVDGAAFSTYTIPLTFAEGRHTVSFRAIDRVGNVEAAQTLSLRSDASAPQTDLVAQGGRQAPGGTGFYASSDTRFAFAAIDPIVADVAAGADFTRWQDNGGALQAYSTPFSLSEGSHLLGFQSQDRVSNLEALRSSTVFVDATAPVSSYAIGDPLYIGLGAVIFITPTTPVTFSAEDATLPGGTPGAGTDRIEVATDGGPFVAYSAALNFAEGRHTVLFRAVDRVGNVEATQTMALRSDATAPETSLAVQGGKQVAGTVAATFYASSDTRFALPAADPIVADVASGVDFTTYRDNGGAVHPYNGLFSLPAGSHLLTYQSRDVVRNQEVSRTTTVFVDAAPPLTAFAIGAPSLFDSDGTRYITPATPVSFTAADPALPGGTAGSGVERIEVSVDGGPYTACTSPLTFAEGRHTVQFRSSDRVGNVETAQSLSLRSDSSAPRSSLAAQGGRQAPGPDSASFYASSDTRFGLPAADPVVADVASGVDFTRWQDNGGALQTFSTPLALTEGAHRLDFQSQDRVANLEALRSTTVYIDATAPISSYSIGDPLYTGVGAVKFITPVTPVTFSAEDAAFLGGTPGAGTERIEVAVDGGAFVTYTAALTFAEGRHTVLFRAVDRVGNVEVAQSLELRSDASAPETSLALLGGKQAPSANPGTFYASFDTRFALPAVDPIVADVASGVDFTTYRDNGGTLQAYSGPVALSAGSHLLTYQSRDTVRNQEVSRSTTVLVDSGAPVSSYSIGEPLYNAPGGIKFITPATPVTFSATDPALPGGTAGAGVDRIEVAVDGGPFTAYSSPLTFAEGRHTVEFRAVDRVGNIEPTQSLALRSDASAPETSLALQGGRQVPAAAASTFYASSDTRFALPAADPVVADVASGVDFTTYRDNGGAVQPYSAPFTLSAGSHLLSYQSRDTVRNQEITRSTTIYVDAIAPITAFTIGAPGLMDSNGTRFITPATPVSFTATDPALPGGTAGAGVDRIEVAIDGGPFVAYSAALTFAEGRHTLLVRAVDRVGNVEAAQTLALRSDATAPETSLAVQGGKQSAGPNSVSFYASSDTRFALPASDPIAADVASGVDFTSYRDNGGSVQPYSAAFSLPEGSHSLSYQSRDRVTNLETQRSTTVLVDATAPLSSFAIGAPAFVDQDGIRYITPATPVSFTAADPALPGGAVGSGVERIEVAVDGGSFAPYSAALTFPEGRHTVQFRAVDRVGNVEAAQSLALRSDASAPMTSLTPQGGRRAAGPDNATFYASSDTRIALSAFDPVGADVASGLEITRWQDSGGAFQTYSAPFALPEGSHLLAYQSQDRVANLEILRSTTILVDATAPQSSFAIGTPAFVDTDGTRYVTPATQITFAAQDPALLGGAAGSGVERIEVAVDGGAFSLYATPLSFAEGRHTVQFRAIDRVGNMEVTQTLALRSDASAPQTSLHVQGGTQAAGPDAATLYASSATQVVLTPTDPTVAEVASGVDFIRWQDNGGPLSTYSTPLTLTEGAHLLAYQSRDRVENLEVLRSTTILLDASAPQSTFAIGLPSFTGSDGTRFITPATPVSLTALDPALPGGTAGSGVGRIEVAIDGGAFAAYTAALTFHEGRHTVQFRAIDRVGNIEATQSLALRSDNSNPQTSLAVQGGRQVAGPTAESFYASSDTRFGLPAADPTVADVASGVDFTRWQDSGGAFQTYSAPFALAEGSHLLAYQSQDHVTNLEALRSTTVIVDASAPNSAFAIGAPSFVDGDGTRYVTPGTPVSFSAQDPGLPGGTAGSGVERIEVAIDGGAFAPYGAPLTFPEGRHTVLFRAIDRVGNVETAQSLALRSDASAPQTSLAAVGGHQAAGPDAATFYASGDSRFVFPASDPLAADVASGVDFTRWRDGSGAFQTYSAPVALAEGSHLLSYQSQDRVANLEILRSTTVLVDASSPQTAFAIGAPSFVAPDGARNVTPATPVTFSASDPALPGGTAGSGVDRIEVAVNGAAFTVYTVALTFPEGRHTVQFRSVDRVGNSEAAQTLALRSDATPPQTAFSPSAAFYSDGGRDYAPAQFTYTLPAADPLTSDVASGVAETTFAVDAAPREAYTGAFSLTEGIRTVLFASKDNVSNLEGNRTATVHVDATAPQSSLAVSGGVQAPGPDANSFYASPDTRFSLPALDPSVSGVASGLDSTSWQDNGGAFQAFGAPIALGAGSHLLSYRSQDHVGNLEVLRSTTVLVDGAAPVTVFQIGTPAFMAADGTRYVTPSTPVTFTASDPALAGGTVGSGVERIEVSVDGAPFSSYTSALTFSEGRHTVQYRAVDRVGNTEDAVTLALRSDASAPLTSLAAQGGRQVAGPDANTFYASLDTRFALPAADPVVSDVAAGVDITRWQKNSGAFETYTAPLALAEGSHLLAYQSQDKVQNLEILRSTTVLIDATAPLTAFSIGAPSYTDAAGVHYVTPTTPVTFTAADPALPGGTAGSGIERIEVALDAAGFQTYATALTFGEGRHTIRFRAYDKVGNVEAERTLEVRSDASAPLSSLAVQGGRQTAGSDAASQYASADTRIVLSALDPLVADVASGVDLIRWRDNGGAFQTYAAPIALAEGSHVLTYQSQDKVQNVEILRSTTVLVDATAPHTAFQIGTPAFIDLSGTHYITPTTPVTFTAEDPTLPGGAAGAGVERIEVAVDGGTFVTYAAALTFPEGRHTVQFRAMDRVGNVETAQTISLRSDASAPLTSLDTQGGRQAAGANATTFYASSATRYGLLAADPVVADVASGVEFTRWQDNGGSVMSYTGPIAFPEGVHLLTYASEDRVDNLETQKAVTALVDATPPITQFSLNGPRYAHAGGDWSVGGELFVSPTTVIELSSLDPISNGVASGLDRLLASPDGGPFLPYAGAISFFQEGHHTVAYRGADRVGNEEGTRSVSVAVDATAPSTMLTFDGPALVRGPGTTWEPQQAEAFITPVTKVILNTNDLTSAGIASGVKLTRFRIDSGPWQVYTGFFYLSSQGLHLVEFAAEDRVGNLEAVVVKRIAVDNTSPLVSAAINGSWLEAFGLNLLSTAATVSLTANDSPIAGVAVGLARILYRIDGGGLTEYTTPFSLAAGSHTIAYHGVDLLGNSGAPQTLAVRVLRFLGGSLAATGAIDGSGTADVGGLMQTNAGLSLTGNFAATGGAEAFSISLKGGATLTGPVTQGVRPLLSDWVDLAAIQTALTAANDNAALPSGTVTGGVLRLNSGQTVTLATGTYLLSGIDISGGAKLLTAGPVRIFVTGSVKLGGNSSLNEAGPARNMVIFGSGNSADLSAAAAAAVFYFPSAAMSLSGEMRLGGSALAATISLAGNSNATAPGLTATAPPATSGGSGKGSKLASLDGGVGFAAGPLDATFGLRDIYAFPNPAVGGQRPVIHAAVGVADRVTIRIYDIAGQPVHEATVDAPQVIDDGGGPQYAYEYPWGGHIPSGVYLYSVTAEKAGNAPIKRIGKLAVVR